MYIALGHDNHLSYYLDTPLPSPTLATVSNMFQPFN